VVIVDGKLDPVRFRFFQAFRRRIGIPIKLREEPPLSFFFGLSLLLLDLIEVGALSTFSVFDKNCAQVRAKPSNVSFHCA
jgi:hypothetical protein